VVAGAGGGDHPGARGARHRLRSLQPAREGFLTGTIDQTTEFASGDFRNTVPRFTDAEARTANLAFVELLKELAAGREATPA
jgi:hypothetical protein